MIGARNTGPDLSSRAALRFLRSALPDLELAEVAPTLVERPSTAVQPALGRAEVIEHAELRAVPVDLPVAANRSSGFGGFLDGAEKVQVVGYPKGIPIVLGTVSAAIRCRSGRRLVTWTGRSPAVEKRLYVPERFLGSRALPAPQDFQVVDTSAPDPTGAVPERHPMLLVDEAMKRVQAHREKLEQAFARSWCSAETTPLFIDGGISGDDAIASSHLSIGVVKSHRRLYAESDQLGVILGLKKGHRSSVFRVAPRSRMSVASWYLRIRSGIGQDPLWGLVRIEIADSEAAAGRADEISRWVLAESSPLALPDGRWDKMSYPIRDTEEFLRAIS